MTNAEMSAGERITSLLTQALAGAPGSNLAEEEAHKWAEALVILHDRQTMTKVIERVEANPLPDFAAGEDPALVARTVRDMDLRAIRTQE